MAFPDHRIETGPVLILQALPIPRQKPSLIDYVNRYRDAESQIPTGYRVRFAKYDKSLNRQP